LNVVEIKIGVLRGQCLDRRIDSHQRLASEIAALERQRNTSRIRIKWSSQQKKPAPKWAAPVPGSQPKSHNHCADVPEARLQSAVDESQLTRCRSVAQ
jgi:hypothetical protein